MNTTDTTNGQAKPCALPWRVCDEQILTDTLNDYGNFNVCIIRRYGEITPQDKANLKLIVTSVNHADKLAEALRAWEYAGNEGGISMVDWFEVARKKTREALAAYEAAQ